jgi:hypothetical protein
MLKKHLETCDRVLICCKLCDEKNIMKKELNYHFEQGMEKHIDLICDRIENLESEIADTNKTFKTIIKMLNNFADKFSMKTFDDQSDDE